MYISVMSEYAKHLANMQEKANIVATEDIFSDKGVLLAKGGIEINKKTCENILKFKLLKPFEDSISIENQLNAKSIYNIFNQLVSQDQWLSSIHSQLGDKVALQRCCLRLEKYPILLQKLTVLKIELFHIFEQAIFSAYLAYICAMADKLEQGNVEEFFLAGMLHDIGFLHINHEILRKEGDLTPEEWRNIQSHPVIGYEIVKNMSNFPQTVARAILEHHENSDGSGYPRNKTKHALCDLGQLINVLDNTIAIYNKKIKQQKRSIRGVIPVIQINIHSYSYKIASMVIRALKHAPESTPDPEKAKTLSVLISHTKKKQQYVHDTTIIIKDANNNIGYEHNNKEMLAIQNSGNNILLIVNSSGLSDPDYCDGLSGLLQDKPENLINEVEDAHLMLSEVMYQINTYQKNATAFTHNNKDHPLSLLLTPYLKQVDSIDKPKLGGSFQKTATG